MSKTQTSTQMNPIVKLIAAIIVTMLLAVLTVAVGMVIFA